jgi:hypothetical protein
MKLGKSDRTPETQAMYQHDVDNSLTRSLLDEPPIMGYEHWRLIVNRYPYDARWCTSMMLVLNRESSWSHLSMDEVRELHTLKCQFKTVFDKIEENGQTMTSVPTIPHIHLLQGMK